MSSFPQSQPQHIHQHHQHQHHHAGNDHSKCNHQSSTERRAPTIPGTTLNRAMVARYVCIIIYATAFFDFYTIFVHIYGLSLNTRSLPTDAIVFGFLWAMMFISYSRGVISSPGKMVDGWYKKYPEMYKLLIAQYATQQRHKKAQEKAQLTNSTTNPINILSENSSNLLLNTNEKNANAKQTEIEIKIDEQESLIESDFIELPKNYARPARAHYCYELQSNILRMDHFCVWFNNAVGFYNYKYFFLALFYLCLSSIVGNFIVVYRLFVDPIDMQMMNSMVVERTPLQAIWRAFCILLAFGSGIFFIIFTLMHMYMHLWQTSKNLTSIEAQKFMQLRATAFHFKLVFPNTHGYDHGCWKNFKKMFGWDVLLWLCPTRSHFVEDGYKFEINEKNKMLMTKLLNGIREGREETWQKNNFAALKKNND